MDQNEYDEIMRSLRHLEAHSDLLMQRLTVALRPLPALFDGVALLERLAVQQGELTALLQRVTAQNVTSQERHAEHLARLDAARADHAERLARLDQILQAIRDLLQRGNGRP